MPSSYNLAETAPDAHKKVLFKQDLLVLLKMALKIELSTIPLYLYSMYSIQLDKEHDKDRFGLTARTQILIIIHQEMLHLSLAGNLYRAVDDDGPGPKLYDKDFIPTYGSPTDTILNSNIPLRLERFEKSNLDNFLRLEAPYEPPPNLIYQTADGDILKAHREIDARTQPVFRIAETYDSIGEFYRDVEKMIVASAPYLKFSHKDKQFSGGEFFQDLMVQVVDQPSAYNALTTIIDQGEGSVGVEEAHYQMFLELYSKRTLWSCWPVVASPRGTQYSNYPFINSLSLAFNAAYCYLLLSIETTWTTGDPVRRRALIGNIHGVMLDILGPVAFILVQQPLPGSNNQNAGPTFEFYPPGRDALPPVQLYEALKNHVNDALRHADEKWKESLRRVQFVVGNITWPRAA